MHELAIVHGIVEAVTEKCAGARILRVVIEVGQRTALLPDSLRFCFDLAAEGTLAEGAELDVLVTPGTELRIKEMELA